MLSKINIILTTFMNNTDNVNDLTNYFFFKEAINTTVKIQEVAEYDIF